MLNYDPLTSLTQPQLLKNSEAVTIRYATPRPTIPEPIVNKQPIDYSNEKNRTRRYSTSPTCHWNQLHYGRVRVGLRRRTDFIRAVDKDT